MGVSAEGRDDDKMRERERENRGLDATPSLAVSDFR